MKSSLFLKRSLALAVDLVVFYMAALLAGFHHGELVLLWLAYETVLVSQWRGATLGKFKMQLKVTTQQKKAITLFQALVRSVVKIGSTAVFLLGDLWALKDKKSRTWHDKAAGTVVVQNVR